LLDTDQETCMSSPWGCKCCVEGTLGRFKKVSCFDLADAFPPFSFPRRFETLFSPASSLDGLTPFAGVCGDASIPLEPSLGGTGGFEEEYRRWWFRVAARQAEQATLTAADERGTTGSDAVDVRATQRTDEVNMVKQQELKGRCSCACRGGGRCLKGLLLVVRRLTRDSLNQKILNGFLLVRVSHCLITASITCQPQTFVNDIILQNFSII